MIARPVPPAIVHNANREHLPWPAVERLALDARDILPSLEGRIVSLLSARVPDDRRGHVHGQVLLSRLEGAPSAEL